MLKTIYNKFDKHKINSLPKVEFPGRIITIFSEGEAERAIDYLLKQPILGIDTETRPSFHRGRQNMVALLQVSTLDTCFLFRLNMIGMTPAIIRFLEDTNVPKIGLSLKDDILMLNHRAEFTPGYFYDLQQHVKEIGIEDLALQKLYANIFGQKMSKAQRLSNWESHVLTDAQKRYAATDAWSCIMLYNEIERLKQTGEYELVMVEEPKPAEKD
ncbi:MAG: 3'-5' exonuclease domain-containing protein 2 [Bacteroidaceae bacterium]|nr:3'-5' exonuclease domain-containing protein 2 [Bacteroidaceae bacterium]